MNEPKEIEEYQFKTPVGSTTTINTYMDFAVFRGPWWRMLLGMFLTLLTLKLMGDITWPWWAVSVPAWLSMSVIWWRGGFWSIESKITGPHDH